MLALSAPLGPRVGELAPNAPPWGPMRCLRLVHCPAGSAPAVQPPGWTLEFCVRVGGLACVSGRLRTSRIIGQLQAAHARVSSGYKPLHAQWCWEARAARAYSACVGLSGAPSATATGAFQSQVCGPDRLNAHCGVHLARALTCKHKQLVVVVGS